MISFFYKKIDNMTGICAHGLLILPTAADDAHDSVVQAPWNATGIVEDDGKRLVPDVSFAMAFYKVFPAAGDIKIFVMKKDQHRMTLFASTGGDDARPNAYASHLARTPVRGIAFLYDEDDLMTIARFQDLCRTANNEA